VEGVGRDGEDMTLYYPSWFKTDVRPALDWDGKIRQGDVFRYGSTDLKIYAVLTGPAFLDVVLVDEGGAYGTWMLVRDFKEHYRHVELVYRETT